ncbi:MAG TPA: 2-hydroxychromene-2-carboxylate isomerase [Burkholderiaceae bacterium]|nr:2-hydroxychromene-2-carboxylate isomerase [Burkholderiaceae bacterium]
MKRIVFWFDVISPFAYLAFEHLPQALEGCSYEVQYRPVLFAGLLSHWGQKGPAEIPPKRAWTFRHIAWLSHTLGIPIDTPATHPFNPLPLLRLSLACCDAGGTPNRHVVETLMRHVWRGGADASEAARLRALADTLAPRRDPAADEVKSELRTWSNEAVARGVFGVPTFDLGGRLFWGIDALPMLRAALQGDAWFDGPQWDAAAVAPPGISR